MSGQMEPDDNTLDNAGDAGRMIADQMAADTVTMIETIFRFRDRAVRIAAARIIANGLIAWADEEER
jgi:hypothetical protein